MTRNSRNESVRWVVTIALFFSLFLCPGCGGGGGTQTPVVPATGSATVSWDPVTRNLDGTICNDLGGYKVYYSESPGVTQGNSQMVDAGNVTTVEISNLPLGHTYYFRASAYNIAGNESPLSSEEVSKPL